MADLPIRPTHSPPLRVGVIGTGYFSRFHYDAWAQMDDVELVALATLDTDEAARVAARHGIASTYADMGEMISTEALDLVDIIAPPPVHLHACRLAASSGVAAICQKPFCGDLATARKAAALAEDAGTLLVVHENFRFQPWYGAIHDAIAQDHLGDLFQATFRLRPGDGQGPQAYLERQPYFQEMPRFLVHETAIHLIDVLRYLFGEIVAVTADLRRLNPVLKGEDAGLIIFEHENGLRTLFDGNRLSDHDAENTRRTMGEMTIEGARGVITLNGDADLSFRAHGTRDIEPVTFDWHDRGFGGDCVYSLQRHVVDHLTQGTAVMNTAADYLRNQEIEEAVYRSATEECRIAL
jgi:predicted dehydrogenase